MKRNKCLKLFSFKESSARVTQPLKHMVLVIRYVFLDCKWCRFSWRGRNKRATGGRQRAVLRSAGQYRHVGPHCCRPLYTSSHGVQKHTLLFRETVVINNHCEPYISHLSSVCWRTESHGFTGSSRDTNSTSWQLQTQAQWTGKF